MQPIRIVIADDDPMIRELVSVLMKHERIAVIGEAGEGLAAVELSLQLRPDVTVLDRRMPELGATPRRKSSERRIRSRGDDRTVISRTALRDRLRTRAT